MMAIAVKKSEKFYFLLFLQMSFKNKRNFFDRALQQNSNYLFQFQKEFCFLAIFLITYLLTYIIIDRIL